MTPRQRSMSSPKLPMRMLGLTASLLIATMVSVAPAGAQTAAIASLFEAVQRDDPHGLRTALLRGADPNTIDELGQPVIVLAAKERAWRAVRALAELRGTRLDATDKAESNAMMYAALHGELQMVAFLIERKAEVNKTGWTPLHFAAANGHAEIVRFLLEHHAYIDAESPNRTTPLMMATRQGHPTVATLLVDEGADPTLRNDAGFTAAQYASSRGDPKRGAWLETRAEAFARRYRAPSSGQ